MAPVQSSCLICKLFTFLILLHLENVKYVLKDYDLSQNEILDANMWLNLQTDINELCYHHIPNITYCVCAKY